MVLVEDNRCGRTDSLDGRNNIWSTGASTSIIPTIFTPDALPAATLSIYPGLEPAPSMLDCIAGGLVKHTKYSKNDQMAAKLNIQTELVRLKN